MWYLFFHIKSLRKEIETLEETCIICNFIFSTSAARACDILLCLSACLSTVKNIHYRDPAWWMRTYVARSTNRLSLLLAGARKFQLSFFCSGRRCSLGQAGNLPRLLHERSLLKRFKDSRKQVSLCHSLEAGKYPCVLQCHENSRSCK